MYGIVPDLTCLGENHWRGLPPLPHLEEKREIMETRSSSWRGVSGGTLSGNPVAMSAGLKSSAALEAPRFYEDLEEKTQGIFGANSEENRGERFADGDQ